MRTVSGGSRQGASDVVPSAARRAGALGRDVVHHHEIATQSEGHQKPPSPETAFGCHFPPAGRRRSLAMMNHITAATASCQRAGKWPSSWGEIIGMWYEGSGLPVLGPDPNFWQQAAVSRSALPSLPARRSAWPPGSPDSRCAQRHRHWSAVDRLTPAP